MMTSNNGLSPERTPERTLTHAMSEGLFGAPVTEHLRGWCALGWGTEHDPELSEEDFAQLVYAIRGNYLPEEPQYRNHSPRENSFPHLYCSQVIRTGFGYAYITSLHPFTVQLFSDGTVIENLPKSAWHIATDNQPHNRPPNIREYCPSFTPEFPRPMSCPAEIYARMEESLPAAIVFPQTICWTKRHGLFMAGSSAHLVQPHETIYTTDLLWLGELEQTS